MVIRPIMIFLVILLGLVVVPANASPTPSLPPLWPSSFTPIQLPQRLLLSRPVPKYTLQQVVQRSIIFSFRLCLPLTKFEEKWKHEFLRCTEMYEFFFRFENYYKQDVDSNCTLDCQESMNTNSISGIISLAQHK